jgi:hypothetical protein
MATQYTAGIVQGQKWTAAIANQIGAAWETWTPAVTQTGAVACTTTGSKYTQINKLVIASTYVTVTGAGTGGSAVFCTVPLTAAATTQVVTYGYIYDASAATVYNVTGILNSTIRVGLYYQSGNEWGIAPNIALAVNDQLRFVTIYEAA